MTLGAWGDTQSSEQLLTEDAAGRLRTSFAALEAALERKQNFDPNQPREPKGAPTGGRWALVPRGAWRVMDTSAANRATRAVAARVDAFVIKHRKAIIRTLGGIQTFDGLAEAGTGMRLAFAGDATAGTGVGAIGTALGVWMVFHGYDNFEAGIWALVTGYPQETNLFRTLRGFELSEPAAQRVELALSGGVLLGGGLVARRQAQALMRASLLRRTLRAFDPARALDVRRAGVSIWEIRDIRLRGDAWEEFDAARTGFQRYPYAKTFDQISSDWRVAISNKTLDMYRETYLRTDRKALFNKLRGYIDDAAGFTPVDPTMRMARPTSEKRIHLLLRFGDTVPGQELQIAAAEQYAKDLGIILQIEYAH